MANLLCMPITAEELRAWQSCIPTHHYPAGQILFYSGHLPYGVYIFAKGAVDLVNARGQRKIGEITDCNIVGAVELVHGTPYVGTAKVVQQTSALFAEKSRFLELIYNNRDLLPTAIRNLELFLIRRYQYESSKG